MGISTRDGRELVRYTRTFLDAGVVNFSTCQDLPSTRSRQPGLIRFICVLVVVHTHTLQTLTSSREPPNHCPPIHPA